LKRGDAVDQGSLVKEQIDAGARFLGEFQNYLPVQIAFWVKESEEGAWNLYVASDRITDDNFDVAYGEVLRIAGVLRDSWFDPFQVKLVGEEDPVAQAALDLHQRAPGRTSTLFHGKTFDGLSVDEVYVYPSPIPAAMQ
jgi:hypothetical protein